MKSNIITATISLVMGVLIGAVAIKLIPRTMHEIPVESANYAFARSEAGKSVMIARDNLTLCRIQEIGENRIGVQILNDDQWIVNLRMKHDPDYGLMNLEFKTPNDEKESSQATYQWLGSNYTESPDLIGVTKYPLE